MNVIKTNLTHSISLGFWGFMRFSWVMGISRDHTTPVIVLVQFSVLLLQLLHLLISHLIRAVLASQNLVGLFLLVLVASEQVGPDLCYTSEHVAELLF